MGAACCKIPLAPGRIHAKKVQELYATYLKNQNKNPDVDKGENTITPEIIEQVENFSRANVKELIRILQIDQQFVPRMSRYLIRKADLNPDEPSNLSIEL
jgi:hypothetical protein